ncbi:MAG: hypothetical protein KAQ98_04685 [Bacteriovoracaceae bacterium]|nr:hypothetical protein [Bacteriovoracaceae bacterium]
MNEEVEFDPHKNLLNKFPTIFITAWILMCTIGITGIFIVYISAYNVNQIHQKNLIQLSHYKNLEHKLVLLSKTIINASNADESTIQKHFKKSKNLLIQINKKLEESSTKKTHIPKHAERWHTSWTTFNTKLMYAIQKNSLQQSTYLQKELKNNVRMLKNINIFFEKEIFQKLENSTRLALYFICLMITLLIVGFLLGTTIFQRVTRNIKSLLNVIMKSKKNNENLLNNLGHGFLVFDEHGNIQKGCSKATIKIFGSDPTGYKFHEIIDIDSDYQNLMKDWYQMIFYAKRDFEDILPLAPQKYDTGEKFIKLDYRPIYDNHGQNIEHIICIATDETEIRKLKQETKKERAIVDIIMIILKDRRSFKDFLHETTRLISYLKDITSNNFNIGHINEVLRVTHSLRGNTSTYHFFDISKIAASLEEILILMKEKSKKEFSLIVPSVKSKILTMEQAYHDFLEEHKFIINSLIEEKNDHIYVPINHIKQMNEILKNQTGGDSHPYELFVDNFVLQKISDLFKRFETTVDEIATSQNKEVHLYLIGSTIKVFASAYKSILSSMVHAFRNAVDHGIESDEEKSATGKKEPGIIYVNFEKLKRDNMDFVEITICDNGRGISPERIKQLAIDKKLISRANIMNNEELLQLVFIPGLSSKKQATNISGRGIGLDAIKIETEKIGGWTDFYSEEGNGSKLVVTVPIIVDPYFVQKEKNIPIQKAS